MWWSRLLVCVAVLGLGPAGCGFEPIYARNPGAESSAIAAELAAIQVAGIEDRIGQQLRNALVLSLSPRGEPQTSRYVLTVVVQQSMRGLANSRDGNATVGEVYVNAIYGLTEVKTGQTVLNNQASSYSGYRYLGPRYGSTVSERDSEAAAVNEVAREIRGALAAFFADRETFAQRMKARPAAPGTIRSPDERVNTGILDPARNAPFDYGSGPATSGRIQGLP